MDKKQTSTLNALWDELNQNVANRQEANLQAQLEKRAKVYARPQKQDITYADDEVYHIITFQLGTERYGIDVLHVRGVRPATTVTRVPGVPNFYRGVVNIRGRIVSALDLRHFFNIQSDKSDMPDELILVETQDLYLAVLAHHIEEVSKIPRERVESVDMHYAKGVTSDRLVILDIETLFSDERLIIGGKGES